MKFQGRRSKNYASRTAGEKAYIYGRHALEEALAATPHAVKKVFLSPDAPGSLKAALDKNGIPVTIMKPKEASTMVGSDASHQGVIAVIDPSRILVDFRDFAKDLSPSPDTLLVLLDELTDPQNVGAIIRSAAAFGATAVLLPVHNQAQITGSVVKASVGMVFRIPLVSVSNVNSAVDILKNKGVTVYGLAMKGARDVMEEPFEQASLIIVGNEGRGIREKTFERCDSALRIPMHSRCESLNASVSAAIVCHAWSMRHKNALQ